MTDSHAPMRVALFTDTFVPQINGVARTLGRTVATLRSRGHSVRVFAPQDPDASGVAADPNVRHFPSRPFWAYRQLRLALPRTSVVERELLQWRPDVVHLATPFGVGLAGRAAARRIGVPIITSYHTSLAAYAKFYGLGALASPGWAFLRWFHNSGRRTLCPTEAIGRDLTARGFRNISLWSRGVDAEQFSPSHRSETLRRSWGASPATTVVAYVGRLAREKGLDTALAAMRRLVEQQLDVVCVVAGDGPYESECRRLAPRGTIFTGRIEGPTLSETYASCDAFIFPSTTDTFGNVVLEAMASGLAVVAADVPQTREVLGGAGLVVPPSDPVGFSTALAGFASNPAYLGRIRADALRSARHRSWQAVFDRLVADYYAVTRGLPASADRVEHHSDVMSIR
ncbi:MAG TPA: glycosyltransferase family 1 protein [Gemmatimonadaceae bacterium]|jgi:glycosyltransferase involved in cell wall biosynthesis